MGILVSGLMMVSLPRDTWLRLIIWLIIGMAVYFFYGRHHSRVQAVVNGNPKPTSAPQKTPVVSD
jgi:APA family basic amino acid/polyamine antiporter